MKITNENLKARLQEAVSKSTRTIYHELRDDTAKDGTLMTESVMQDIIWRAIEEA